MSVGAELIDQAEDIGPYFIVQGRAFRALL